MTPPGMQHRLQTIFAEAADTANRFDLTFWKNATHLAFFGVELRVHTGAVTLILRHRQPDGQVTELAVLDCPHPGSCFSPPLELAHLASVGGTLVPDIVARSTDAEFDAYFGTNDLPACPHAQVAFAALPGRATRPTLREICHQQVYGLAPPHSPDSDLHSPSTHLALIPDSPDDPAELRARCQTLACFLRGDTVLHTPTMAVLDLRLICRYGLPDADLATYMTQLHQAGITRHAPAGTLPPLPVSTSPSTGPSTGLLSRLRARLQHPRSPSPEVARLRLDQLQQAHHIQQALAHSRHQSDQRLKDAHLWDPAQVRADLDRANRTTLTLLRNRHKGQRAVIIGNGPSLRIPDLDRLQDVVTFASNKIYLAYDETRWRPTYYSVEDHLVLLNSRARIEALTGSIKLFPANTRDFGYHAADTIFAPFLPPRSFEDPLADPAFPAFSHDLSQGIAWGSTITYSQIQMAAFMGCTEIILIGLDHSYQLPSQKRGNQYIHDGEQNHFHPDYRSPGEAWHQPNLEVLERSYAKARDVCVARGIRILNASRQTRLDVFERADFDQLFPATGETR